MSRHGSSLLLTFDEVFLSWVTPPKLLAEKAALYSAIIYAAAEGLPRGCYQEEPALREASL